MKTIGIPSNDLHAGALQVLEKRAHTQPHHIADTAKRKCHCSACFISQGANTYKVLNQQRYILCTRCYELDADLQGRCRHNRCHTDWQHPNLQWLD